MKKNKIASKGPQVLHRNIRAFKKVEAYSGRRSIGEAVIELLIPKGSTVVRKISHHWFCVTASPKCRTDRVKAIRIVWVSHPMRWGQRSMSVKDGRTIKLPKGLKLRSSWMFNFVYKLGRYAKSRLNRCTTEQCASGLHFYLTKLGAIRH